MRFSLGGLLALLVLLSVAVARADDAPRVKPPVQVTAASLELKAPEGISLTPERWLLVADPAARAALLLDEEGNLLLRLEAPPQTASFQPTAAVSAADGLLYVNDPVNRRVLVFGLDGKLVRAETGPAREGPWTPIDLALGPDGGLVALWNDTLVLRARAGAGSKGRPLGLPGRKPGEWGGDTRIAVGSAGRLVVSDRNGRHLHLVDPEGKVTRSVDTGCNPEAVCNWPAGVALDAQGKIYLTDPTGGRVLVFDPAGKPAAAFKLPDGSRPCGVCVSADGWIFVADAGRGRVLRLDPTGQVVQEIGKPAR